MATMQHAKAVSWAVNRLGQREEPLGSNTGPFVRQCQEATWLAGSRWPWCVAFWIKAWKTAGRKLPYLGAGAYAMLDWYRKHLPGWVVPIERAKPGAAVIYNVGSGHCAMLERFYSETKPYVATIDGNVSDMVARRSRHVSLVRGVIDPPERDIGAVKPAKPPVFEVVTSESGHKKLIYASGARAVGRKLPALLKRYGGLGGITIRRRK
jgi:hypothetical protein